MLSIMTYILSSKTSFLRHSLKYGLHLVQGAKTEQKCFALPILFMSLLYQRQCLPGQVTEAQWVQSLQISEFFSPLGACIVPFRSVKTKAWPFTPTSPSLSISCSSSSQKMLVLCCMQFYTENLSIHWRCTSWEDVAPVFM